MERINKNNYSVLLKNCTQTPIAQYTYDRDKIKAGIVHLGVGAFHRAHQAWYTEAVLNAVGGDWAIIGCSLRSAGVQKQLVPQDGLYTLVERGPEGEKLQLIGAMQSVLVGPENPQHLVSVMAGEDIKIVSLTVTEKGYCHDPATGDLNFSHPDIEHDLQALAQPKSAIGFIVAALQARRKNGVKSFTALSCDNLPNNGNVLHKAVLQFAKKVDPELADWISTNTRFPNTMIDRIVPATTEQDRDQFESLAGYRDEGIVVSEPFSQWVIEDNFCNDRPPWENVGALLVDDVDVYEKIKLRLLNGCHSTLAYCGYLAGEETISEVMQEPAFVKLATLFMDREAGETLVAPPGFDIAQYKQQLRDRFANPGLQHRTWQIAMDGSQKLPQRLLQTLREQLQGNGNIDILCLSIAAWIRYVSGKDEQGREIDVQDPLASRLRECYAQNEGKPEAIVKAILSISEVFGEDLRSVEPFVKGVTEQLQQYCEHGVLATIRKYLG